MGPEEDTLDTAFEENMRANFHGIESLTFGKKVASEEPFFLRTGHKTGNTKLFYTHITILYVHAHAREGCTSSRRKQLSLYVPKR